MSTTSLATPAAAARPRTSGFLRIGVALAVVGGLLAMIGSFLPWFRVERNAFGFGQSLQATDVDTVHGLNVAAGWVALVLGVVAVALGFLVADLRDRNGRMRAGAAILAAGLITMVWSIAQLETEQSRA